MERAVCNRNCWISAAIAGVVVLLFSSGIGDLGWGAGLFLGVITTALFGALMVWLVCHERPEAFVAETGMTRTDWERETVDRQPAALLASASLGPEAYSSSAQMPIVAGAMPGPLARTAQADDLQRIKGIGPKIADWLTENDVTQFAQIATWDDAAVADFAHRLGRMGGRIQSDDWVGQARILAEGGQTEHSQRVQRGEQG